MVPVVLHPCSSPCLATGFLLPMNTKLFKEKLAKAEVFVAECDCWDGHKDRTAATIYATLECGLKKPSTNAQFEALVMLRDVAELEKQRRNSRKH